MTRVAQITCRVGDSVVQLDAPFNLKKNMLYGYNERTLEEGLFARRSFSQVLAQVIAIESYNAVRSEEISYKKGDIINVVGTDGGYVGWMKGNLNGVFGVFSTNMVKNYRLGRDPERDTEKIKTKEKRDSVSSTDLPKSNNWLKRVNAKHRQLSQEERSTSSPTTVSAEQVIENKTVEDSNMTIPTDIVTRDSNTFEDLKSVFERKISDLEATIKSQQLTIDSLSHSLNERLQSKSTSSGSIRRASVVPDLTEVKEEFLPKHVIEVHNHIKSLTVFGHYKKAEFSCDYLIEEIHDLLDNQSDEKKDMIYLSNIGQFYIKK